MAATPTTATATATGILAAFNATSTAQWKPMRPRPTTIPYTLGAVAALFVIASFFIGARLVVEIRSGSLSKGTTCRRVSLWAVMASYVLYMAVFGMTIYTQNGTMQTQERGKQPCIEDFQKWAKVSFARILCGYTSVWLVKGSFVAVSAHPSPYINV